MPSTPPVVRVALFAAATVAAAAIVGTAGCHNSAAIPTPTTTPSAFPSVSPTPVGSPTPTPNLAVSLAYANVQASIDPTYGEVDGYGLMATVPVPTASPSSTPAPSGVITVHCNKTITFYNYDNAPHTASLLGTVNPVTPMNWPPTFSNANGASAASVNGTAITSSQFSTGNLTPLSGFPTTSNQYTTGAVTGSFYFGDFYDYLPTNPSAAHMRTVITVVCP
jgi:hypothetical protein